MRPLTALIALATAPAFLACASSFQVDELPGNDVGEFHYRTRGSVLERPLKADRIELNLQIENNFDGTQHFRFVVDRVGPNRIEFQDGGSLTLSVRGEDRTFQLDNYEISKAGVDTRVDPDTGRRSFVDLFHETGFYHASGDDVQWLSQAEKAMVRVQGRLNKTGGIFGSEAHDHYQTIVDEYVE